MRVARIPAYEIDVTDEEIAAKLCALGYMGDPRTAPTALRACARAAVRAEKDKGRWAAAQPPVIAASCATPPVKWRPPLKLRIVAISGRDRATGDID